jgi:hypothetical protein
MLLLPAKFVELFVETMELVVQFFLLCLQKLAQIVLELELVDHLVLVHVCHGCIV